MSTRNFTDLSEQFTQSASGGSERGNLFNFKDGNDRLNLFRDDDFGGLGLDGIVNMGEGHDTVVTSFNTSGTFNLGTGNDLFLSEGTEINFAVFVDGGSGNDIFAVTTNSSTYLGGSGNDVMLSNGADNTFNGGTGTDTYSAELVTESDGADIDLAAGEAFAEFNLRFDELIDIENVRGSDFGDLIFGDTGNNRLDGLGGDDGIGGDGGNDTISGGSGENTLEGNAGTDTLVVNGTVTAKSGTASSFNVSGTENGVAFLHHATTFEQVLFNGSLMSAQRFLSASASNTFIDNDIAETNVIPKIESILAGRIFHGNDSANFIDGTVGVDEIYGNGGGDTIKGNGGVDRISGNDGNDIITGGTSGDEIRGGDGNDNIKGDSGKDTLFGNVGNDTLTGGSDKDIFVFTSTLISSNVDTVTDYSVASDTIQVSDTIVSGLAEGNLTSSKFKNTSSSAVDSTDRIIYDSSTGKLFFDSNGSASGSRLHIATLDTGLGLTASDIVII